MPRAGGVLAGTSAALAAALQVAAGANPWLAVGVTFAGLALAFQCGGNRKGSMRLREAILVGIAIVLPPVALANDIVFGWHSASVLGEGAINLPSPTPPAWAIAILALALVTGLIRGIRVKR
jgi:hypothetical protein